MRCQANTTALALMAMVSVLAAGPAAATTNSLTYQNVTFNMSKVDDNTFTLEILNALNATGNWYGIGYMKAFLVKDIGTFTGGSAVSNPVATWIYANNQLSANACNALGTNPQNLCFSTATPLALTNDMDFTITTVGGTVDFAAGNTGNPHLMVNFYTGASDTLKTGSNLSQDIPAVPEPETYATMLVGLAALGFLARRRRR